MKPLSTLLSATLSAAVCAVLCLSTPVARASTCSVPSAIPNDGLDDRAAIQQALDQQGCAYLPAGVYDIETPSFVPPARRIYAMLTLNGAHLYGDGPASLLRFKGSAGGQDWEGVRMTGAGPALHDLSMDTASLSMTGEQTHASKILGPAADAEVFHMSYNHPQRGEPGGDCIQLVGYAASLITNARIHDNDFLQCDRSGVAIHSGARGLQITNNQFHDTGDQDVDGEGSGENIDWLIAHNTFSLGQSPQGDFALQLQLATNVRVTENVFAGRGIYAYSCTRCEFDHNEITRTTGSAGTGVVEISKASPFNQIHDNFIRRAATAGDGPVIRLVPHNSGTPDHATITNNVLRQETTGDVIYSVGLVGLNIEYNDVTYSGGPNLRYGLLAYGSAGTYGIRTTDLHVNANAWKGPLKAVIGISGSYMGAGTLAATLNTAAVTGVICGNINTAGGIQGPFAVVSNSWLPSICSPLIGPDQ